jgi:uncharacterized membrane protein
MINTVNEYLRLLRKELAGCDRAVIQDALSDAEEYLRNALGSAGNSRAGISEADALPAIIEKYGTPEEVAMAYREIETRIPPYLAPATRRNGRHPASRFFGVVADPRMWGALFYLLFSLVTGIIYFTWAVTGISLSLGLMVLIIGVPFAGLFILSVRGLAMLEGRIVEALLGVRMPRRPLFSSKDRTLWERFKALASDRHTWLSMLYMLLHMPIGIIYFTVFITLIAISLWLIVRPILELVWGQPAFIAYVPYYTPGWLMPIVVVAGFILLILTMHLAKVMGRLHGMLAKAMLVRE